MSARIVVAGAVMDAPSGVPPRLLLAQRSRPPALHGLWELPGGKVEPGETRPAALRRELSEELGIEVGVGVPLAATIPLAADVTLVAHWAVIENGEPVATEHEAIRWVDADTLRAMSEAGELVPADTAWLPELLAALAR